MFGMPQRDSDFQRARALHKNGQLNGAMAIYRDLLAQNPHDPDAHHLLGVALFQQGELPRAEQEIRQSPEGGEGGIWRFFVQVRFIKS